MARSSASARFRRSRHLVSYWTGDQCVVRNYVSGILVAVPARALDVLDFFDGWRSVEQFASTSGVPVADARRAVATLTRATLLERADRPRHDLDRPMSTWKDWNPAAGFFHAATRDVAFQDAVEGTRLLRRKARTNPIPSPVKRYPGARRYELPRLTVRGEFPGVLLARRTWRQFSPEPIDRDHLATLLGLTGGIQHWATIPGQGRLPLKTSPSGGGRHPIELYVCARRVRDLPTGLYHYAPDRHRLELVASQPRAVRIERYLPTQFWYSGAAAVVFFTAVFERYQWKYDYPRAYRGLLIEAGHQCQTFCLVAEWLGLAPFCSMALADSRIEQDLGLDGVSEAVLYAAGVGARPIGVDAASKPAGFRPLTIQQNPWVLAASVHASSAERHHERAARTNRLRPRRRRAR